MPIVMSTFGKLKDGDVFIYANVEFTKCMHKSSEYNCVPTDGSDLYMTLMDADIVLQRV